MNIYQRLKDDHGKHRGLCAALLKTEGHSEERERLFAALKGDVEAHVAAEEQVFYSELMAHEKGQDQAQHSVAEHKEAHDLIEELSDMDMSSPAWLQKFKTLKEELEHHENEEEEEVFPLMRKIISEARAKEMVAEFDQVKDKA
ncbi:hemerythrin domain-containing protein [Woodsholea maritima]|uniref:hemerythrin domain-containing protein n=1 Tax=Woodsholea maritima TaxID=240237 RepID=UPI00037727F0|nr:hemerythrin domain-containing protein [Woodsholea maritima]